MRLNKLLVTLVFSMLFGNAVAANYEIGIAAYESGDYKTALSEFLPLAEQGDAKAQYKLGELYFGGNGVTEDYKTAFKWYTLAAEQGYASAQISLGAMYSSGMGVLENTNTAVRFYILAAEQGNSVAQRLLGMMFYKTFLYTDSPKNDKIAVKWFTLAAEQGDADIQSILGGMYKEGSGVLTDYARAYMWYDVAAYNGSTTGSDNKERISTRMIPAQVAKAQDMSSRCLESSYTDCGGPKMTKAELSAFIQEVLNSLIDDQEQQVASVEQQATNGQDVASSVQYIVDEIRQRWVLPANARNGMVVELVIYLVPAGEVVDIEISYRDASATDAFVASVVKAVKKVGRFDRLSQLDPELFDANFRKFTIKFKPEDLRL